MKIESPEAATGGVLYKELFSEVSQCSQGNTCVGVMINSKSATGLLKPAPFFWIFLYFTRKWHMLIEGFAMYYAA